MDRDVRRKRLLAFCDLWNFPDKEYPEVAFISPYLETKVVPRQAEFEDILRRLIDDPRWEPDPYVVLEKGGLRSLVVLLGMFMCRYPTEDKSIIEATALAGCKYIPIMGCKFSVLLDEELYREGCYQYSDSEIIRIPITGGLSRCNAKVTEKAMKSGVRYVYLPPFGGAPSPLCVSTALDGNGIFSYQLASDQIGNRIILNFLDTLNGLSIDTAFKRCQARKANRSREKCNRLFPSLTRHKKLYCSETCSIRMRQATCRGRNKGTAAEGPRSKGGRDGSL